MNMQLFKLRKFGYINLKKTLTVFLSLKCGYSSFEFLVKNGKALKIKLVDPKAMNIFIVRDPYKRIESFYKDKILKCNVQNLQFNQEVLKDYFGLQRLADKDIGFEEFVLSLQKGLLERFYVGETMSADMLVYDQHIFPQYYFYPNGINRIVRLEDDFSMMSIFKEFDSDLIKRNVSPNGNLFWSEEMKKVIMKIFAEDFELYRSAEGAEVSRSKATRDPYHEIPRLKLGSGST